MNEIGTCTQMAVRNCYSQKTFTQNAYEGYMQNCLVNPKITVVSYGTVEKVNQFGDPWEEWMDSPGATWYTKTCGMLPNAPTSSESSADLTVDQFLDGIQTFIDFVGLLPVVGEAADGVNALIYLARGDYLNAGLSSAAMIPFAGWGATGTKLGIKVGKEVLEESVEKVAKEVVEEGVEKAAKEAAEKAAKEAAEKAAKEAAEKAAKEAAEKAAKEAAEKAAKEAAEKTAKEAAEEGVENVVKHSDEGAGMAVKGDGGAKPKTKAEILAENKAKGRAFEVEKVNEFNKVANNVEEQITVVTKDGTKVRVDAMGYDKATGKLVIQEYKSSAKAH